MKQILPFALIALAFAPQAQAQVAGSVEAGLQQLARQIVEKSTAADTQVIAVLPFPNADGTWSVLSTYIVDELTLALFSVPDSPLTIVERAQIEALLSEMNIGQGGLPPAATQKLGATSGVQALVLGTVTVIGDTLRITSRLVDTKTGRTISAAAVSVPRTSQLNDLLDQIVDPPAYTLGADTAAAPASGPALASRAGARKGSSPTSLFQQVGSEFTSGGLTYKVQNISRTGDNKAVNVVLGVINTGETAADLMFIGSQASLIDNRGNQAWAKNVTGLELCWHYNRWFEDADWCFKHQSARLTKLQPNVLLTVLVRFEADASTSKEGLTGDLVSFSSRMAVRRGDEADIEVFSVSIPNIPVGES